MRFAVVVPWVTSQEVGQFMDAWGCDWSDCDRYLVLQQDVHREGCGVTKNKGVAAAMRMGADVVVVLDGDCYPDAGGAKTLTELAEQHIAALEPQPVELFTAVTSPPSRGTPYRSTKVLMPTAASMGFWTEIGDYCAVRQLAHDCAPMEFDRRPVAYRYFPLCGMNIAFRPLEWLPWCNFIDVPRFDDIWQGWLWQKEAYRRGYCFNLGGPVIRHARQSNVWKNLRDESVHLQANEELWARIATSGETEYDKLRKLLPA